MGIKERSEKRKKRITANIAQNFDDADQWDLEFWQNQTPQERLSALVAIRNDIKKIDSPKHQDDAAVLKKVKELRQKKKTE